MACIEGTRIFPASDQVFQLVKGLGGSFYVLGYKVSDPLVVITALGLHILSWDIISKCIGDTVSYFSYKKVA